MIRNYYYNGQLRKFVASFASVFSGLQVKTGDHTCGIETIDVPIRYGSSDRVVAALGNNNTAAPHSLPIMSCYMTGLNIAPERLHGVNQVDRRTYLEQGGVFPDDVKAIERVMPIPYNMEMELSIYASNTDQMYQILEQILILFDYDMQVQFNDAPFDWAKISKISLLGITNEENYPMGTDRRAIIWSMQFEMPVWLSPPYEVRQNIIQKIKLSFGDLDKMTFDEYDVNGELVPFSADGLYFQETIESKE